MYKNKQINKDCDVRSTLYPIRRNHNIASWMKMVQMSFQFVEASRIELVETKQENTINKKKEIKTGKTQVNTYNPQNLYFFFNISTRISLPYLISLYIFDSRER